MSIDQLSSRFSTDSTNSTRETRRDRGPALAEQASANSQALFSALQAPDTSSKRVSDLIASAKASAVAADAAPEPEAASSSARVKTVDEMLAGVRFTPRSTLAESAANSNEASPSTTARTPAAVAVAPQPVVEADPVVTPATVAANNEPSPIAIAVEPPLQPAPTEPAPVQPAPEPVATQLQSPPSAEPAAPTQYAPPAASQPTPGTGGAGSKAHAPSSPPAQNTPIFKAIGQFFNRRA